MTRAGRGHYPFNGHWALSAIRGTIALLRPPFRKIYYELGLIESFFGALKSELVHHSAYYSRTEARADVFYCIESIYNRRRRHSALDYLCPEVYEQLFHQGVLTFA